MDLWLTKEGDGYRLHRHRYHGGRRVRLVDEKKELIAEIDGVEGAIYAPVRVDESAGNANPYVKVTNEAAKDLVERKGALWYLNPLCGGKDVLLEPLYIPAAGAVG